MNIDWSQVLSDLIFPAVVAVLATLGGYFATYSLTRKQRRDEDNIKRSDFLTNIQNEFQQISVVLEKLKSDISDNNYYSIKTISNASASYARIRQLRSDITLIINEDARNQINDTIGVTISLLEDIDSLEQYLVEEWNKHEGKKKELRKELRSIQVQLLGVNMYLDKDNQIQVIDDSSGKNVIKPEGKKSGVEKLFQDLVNELSESQNQLDQNNKEADRKRLILATRIVDTQTKIRDIQILISKLKSE